MNGRQCEPADHRDLLVRWEARCLFAAKDLGIRDFRAAEQCPRTLPMTGESSERVEKFQPGTRAQAPTNVGMIMVALASTSACCMRSASVSMPISSAFATPYFSIIGSRLRMVAVV
jgi:hypothetical protein